MVTLALDSATPVPSLALLVDGDVLARSALEPETGAGRRIAEELHRLLTAASVPVSALERIVCGVGPGGFTGIRIGIATAMGLAQARRIPVVGVSSLESLALGASAGLSDGELIAPVIDARRNEIFAAVYRIDGDGTFTTIVEPTATSAEPFVDRLIACNESVVLAGDGVHRCTAFLRGPVRIHPDESAHLIDAVMVARRADTGGEVPMQPVYLRLPDAEVNRQARAEAPA